MEQAIIVTILAFALCVVTIAAVAALIINARLSREKERVLKETLEGLRAQFVALASDELAEKSQSLSVQNKNEVSAIAQDLRDDILRSMTELKNAATAAEKSTSQVGAVLKDRLDIMKASADMLGKKAEGLEAALAGGAKRQGAWGEAVLKRVFEVSGLRENIDFVLQSGSRATGIPDSEVTDPAGRTIIIDSKTSLTHFLAACNEEDPDKRASLLAEHLASVKKHIRELSAKDYIARLRKEHPEKNYISTVAMFVPSEAAHAAAMAEDPTLGEYAYEQGVAIVTPLTLLGYLRIVSLAWQQDSVEKNHAEVISKAELLLKRTHQCLDAMEKLGTTLENAHDNYEKAMGLLGEREGKMSLRKPAEDLIALGVKLNSPKAL